MRHITSYLFNHQKNGLLYRSSLIAYLLLSHAALLTKKEIALHKMERRYANKPYKEKAAQVQRDFKAMLPDLKSGAFVSSAKNTTHQFAETVLKPKHRLDSRFLNKAQIDPNGQFVDVEANMSFGDLIKFLAKAGYRIPLVPEFLDITVGGAFVGVAIESSGHKFGLFHEHVLQAETLMADGSFKTSSLKANTDEFTALPNSNGTLGRVTRLRLPLIPLKSAHPDQSCHPFLDSSHQPEPEPSQPELEPAWLEHDSPKPKAPIKNPTEHMHLQYHRYDNLEVALAEFKQLSEAQQVDFIESVVISPNEVVNIIGNVVENADGIAANLRHNYQTRDVFWQHVKDKTHTENYVPLLDYYARWHQTVFWNTQKIAPLAKLLNNPTFRKVFGRFLGPGFLAMLSNARDLWQHYTTPPVESAQASIEFEHMVQDIGIPQDKVAEFASWYEKEIGLYPVWLCPVKACDGRFPNFSLKGTGSYLDWGMFTGDGKPVHPSDRKYYTKLIEAKVIELGGNKALYSDNAFSREQFYELYNMDHYDRMKKKVDPENIFPHVYKKMVASQLNPQANRDPLKTQLPFSFETFRVWQQCITLSVAGSLVAAFWLNRSMLSMSALGLVAGATSAAIVTRLNQMHNETDSSTHLSR
ncbi:MAG: FAD-binding protein [Coxiellaceae bacterium]|nr:FAD-binding protein [Coxiellaceae bacterium]